MPRPWPIQFLSDLFEDDQASGSDEDDDLYDEDPLVQCTGCGAYRSIRYLGVEHACFVDPTTGQREVGGSFQ